MQNAEAIVTEDLTKFYGKSRGIESLNLKVKKGEIFGYLGPNGAGKTTTIRLLLNLLFPTRGTASVLGKNITTESIKVREKIGFVSSDINLYPKMTVKEYLDFISRVSYRKPVNRPKMLDLFPVKLDTKIRDLSTGNKRKVSIISAFQFDLEILILDEPTLGLDPFMQKSFYDILKDYRKRDKTVFLSSHNLPEVEKVCDRVGMIRNGFLAAIENVEDLTRKKIKYVDILFEDEVDIKSIKFPSVTDAEIVETNKHTAKIKIKGEIGSFLKEIVKYGVKDITITHASLEEVFMEYYQEEKVNN